MQIHNKLNDNAVEYQKMYEIINKKKDAIDKNNQD